MKKTLMIRRPESSLISPHLFNAILNRVGSDLASSTFLALYLSNSVLVSYMTFSKEKNKERCIFGKTIIVKLTRYYKNSVASKVKN